VNYCYYNRYIIILNILETQISYEAYDMLFRMRLKYVFKFNRITPTEGGVLGMVEHICNPNCVEGRVRSFSV
jgi:hypothetical protein